MMEAREPREVKSPIGLATRLKAEPPRQSLVGVDQFILFGRVEISLAPRIHAGISAAARTAARARARSVCAEMHAGFTALRRHCPLNIEADLRELLAVPPAFKILFMQGGGLAENAGKYLGKGSKVFVQGRIEPTKYEKDGKTEYGFDFIAEEIEYLDTKAPGGGQ